MAIETLLQENRLFKANSDFKKNANEQDNSLYLDAKNDRLKFWDDRARDLEWFKPWSKTLEWNRPFSNWYVGGKLNACYNCLDVHINNETKNKAAIIWEGEDGETITLTYFQLYKKVNQLAYKLKNELGIKKGDRVTLYLPMIPELVISVLACARLGAIHSVVFGGFSAQSLKDRLLDSQSELLITADGGLRRGNVLDLKSIADEGKAETCVKHTIVVNRLDTKPTLQENEIHYADLMSGKQHFQACEEMDSEDTLFILYTSGTTGKPKGIVHSTGGYLTHAKYSTKLVFDLKPQDIYWCTADIGWITGHTYICYGPLSNGATTLIYEGSPDWPNKSRFWNIVEKHGVSILYTAPTAIRAFMKWGDHHPASCDLSSLRLLGTVGEPINPEAWTWYHKHIGQDKCPIVDTWWQTETGGIMISNIPALNDMKPGVAGLPLPGIEVSVLNSDGTTVDNGGGLLSITEPWPSMLRGIWGNEERYHEVYWSEFDTYFCGDGATIDENDYVMVLGRVDDVLNVSGHRIGTMEIESALVEHPATAEAAVVGIPDEIKGQAICAFVILKEGQEASDDLNRELIEFVKKQIGAIAKPKTIIFTPELPKTRSGKIMRRILKSISKGDPVGDTSTLSNPDIVVELDRQLSELITETQTI
ncbi:acetate--CoA ligase [bacterium]|jgi:acetyl-CoA synthetase|nr:acetate--CoA ligase [bacterium]